MPAFEDLWSPIRLTLALASITTFLLLMVGTPIAWWLARSKAPWKEAVATVLALGPLNDLLADPRLPLARSPEASTVLEARVGPYSAEDGITLLDIGGEKLLMPRRLDREGGAERVRIAATDVSLAVDRPSQTTILNIVPVRVMNIHPLDNAQINVLVTIGHREGGPMLLARITRRAQRILGFAPGQEVYAQIKAVSLIGSSGQPAPSAGHAEMI